jgi:hypothetical protein
MDISISNLMNDEYYLNERFAKTIASSENGTVYEFPDHLWNKNRD